MEWIINQLRVHPELAIFLTLFAGFWLGRLKIGKFSLGTVTSVLLVGVLVGQLNITVDGPLKAVFFLLFLFAVGYKVGPQFFRGLKKDGLPQVGFAVLMCIVSLVAPWILAKIMGYHIGEAVGLLAGSQTISAVIGVASDTINQLGISEAQKATYINAIPVSYAVTYIFGTAGSAWILASLGPKLLGGLDKVKADCKELESKMGTSEMDEPGFSPALRPVVFRAYKITNKWFGKGKKVSELEKYLSEQEKLLFVERVRQRGVVKEVKPVMVTHRTFAGEKVSTIRAQKFMHGVSIRSIKRAGINVPVLARTVVDAGDILELTGMKHEVETAAKQMGYVDRPTNQTDMIFVGLGILVGGLVGALTMHLGGVPISLSTSGGALIAGLIFGWLRSKHPTFGGIPEPSLWVLNNVGLNMFIAVVGIAAGPSFVAGFKEVGFSLFIIGALATAIPLLSGLLMGKYLFKFHPALTLGCTAGARTTTAALGAVQDAVESETPALGYTVTYAVGNTLLIIWGVFIVLLM